MTDTPPAGAQGAAPGGTPGGQSQAPGGAQGGQQAPGGQQGQQQPLAQGLNQIQPGPAGYWPESAKDLEANFRGLDDKGTIDKLLADISGRPRAPEKAGDYKLSLPPEIAAKLPAMDQDPALAVYREIALKQGLTNDQFSNTIGEFYAALADKGLLPDTIDPKAELAKLMPDRGIPAEREAAAVNRLTAVRDRIEGMVASKMLDAGEAAQLRNLVSTAQGVQTMEKLFQAMGEHGLQPGGRPAGGQTIESLKAEMADPRYNTQSHKYDAAFRRRVDEDWKRLHTS
jgi:hypothetical protein